MVTPKGRSSEYERRYAASVVPDREITRPLTETLMLENVETIHGELITEYRVDNHRYRDRIYYPDMDFDELRSRFGPVAIERLLVSIAFVHSLKYCALVPRQLHLGRFGRFIEPGLVQLYQVLYQQIFADHRHAHGLGWYKGPEILGAVGAAVAPMRIPSGPTRTLLSVGPGKDSLTCMKLFEKAGLDFSAVHFTTSHYGMFQQQEAVMVPILEGCAPKKVHWVNMLDDFFISPIVRHHFGDSLKSLCVPYTPGIVFAALPLMLDRGYHHIGVGHERSANVGNFYSEVLGQEVNHQWGKSLVADQLINTYVQSRMLGGFHYYSVLSPIYESLIFRFLRSEQEVVSRISSCNVRQPWCRRCPKCAWVWMNLAAWFPEGFADAVLGENLLDVPELAPTFFEMLGMDGSKPLECVGELGEARLAARACWSRGYRGPVMERFAREVLPNEDFAALEEKYLRPHEDGHHLPADVQRALWPLFTGVR